MKNQRKMTPQEQQRRYKLRQARKMVRDADKHKTGLPGGNAHDRRRVRRQGRKAARPVAV